MDDICGGPGMVLLSEAAAGIWFDGSDVVALAIAEATKPDNVAKLSAQPWMGRGVSCSSGSGTTSGPCLPRCRMANCLRSTPTCPII